MRISNNIVGGREMQTQTIDMLMTYNHSQVAVQQSIDTISVK